MEMSSVFAGWVRYIGWMRSLDDDSTDGSNECTADSNARQSPVPGRFE